MGTSTFASGAMATLWPLIYMGSHLFRSGTTWKKLCRSTLFILPIGILATYGRSAWLSVLLVVFSMLLWGSKGAQKKGLVILLLACLLVGQIGFTSIEAKFTSGWSNRR